MNWGAEINRQVANATERELEAARATIRELEKRIVALEAERSALKLEAQVQAQEMRCHRSSLHEAYQYITGATGEPGNWNGARPIKEAVDKLRQALTAERKRREDCEAALRRIPEFAPGPNTLRVISDYFTRYASEAENE